MTSRQEAEDALRERGVSSVSPLLDLASPDQILTVCERFDRRPGGGPGLLVKMIREDEPPAPPVSKPELLRQRFALYAERYPVGSVAETHLRLLERRYPDDLRLERALGREPCPGELVVAEIAYPLLTVECDECGYVGALTPRSLPSLDD
jgi:hypothetical protein